MLRVGFEATIPVYKRAKTVHVLDGAAIVIGYTYIYDTITENYKNSKKPPSTGPHRAAVTTEDYTHHSIQLEYLVATVHGKLRSGRAGPFVKVERCYD
jgi:hypothetical protein